MSFLTPKKLILAGFAVVLLIAIPLMFFLLKQQKNVTTTATAATVVSLSPSSSTVNTGDLVNLDINVDPRGVNKVSFIKLVLNYDATKLATLDAGFTVSSWTLADGTQFTPSILQGPTYDSGTITVTVSTGQSPQDAIQKLTKIGTLSLTAIGATQTTSTQVTFASSTQVLSIGSSDQFSQNILASTDPANVTINEVQAVPTVTPSAVTPMPTSSVIATPSPTPIVSALSPTPSVTVNANSPVCAAMALDKPTQGIVPYIVNFTVTGSSSASTISKVSFNFGDGLTQDVTQSGGIGGNSVNVVLAHTYSLAGTYNATAILTDALGNLSSTANCSQTITVSQNALSTAVASPTATQIAQVSPSPLPPTGPNNTVIAIGGIGLMLTIIGAFLLLAL